MFLHVCMWFPESTTTEGFSISGSRSTDKYIDCAVLPLSISPHHFPNFTRGGSKSVKFGNDFGPRSATLDYEPFSFRKEIRYLKSNFSLLRFDDRFMLWLNITKFGQRPFEPAHLGIWDPFPFKKRLKRSFNHQ